MKIKNEELKVETRPSESVHGAKLEPEERPVDRNMGIDVSLSLGDPGDMPAADAPKLKRGGNMTIVTNVDQAATLLENRCVNCRHFNNPRWTRNWDHWKQSTDPVEQGSRKAFIKALAEHDDPEAFIRQHGVCDKWTDVGVEHGLDVGDAMLIRAPLDVCTKNYCPPKWMQSGKLVVDEPFYESRDPKVAEEQRKRRELLLQIANNAAKKDRG